MDKYSPANVANRRKCVKYFGDAKLYRIGDFWIAQGTCQDNNKGPRSRSGSQKTPASLMRNSKLEMQVLHALLKLAPCNPFPSTEFCP